MATCWVNTHTWIYWGVRGVLPAWVRSMSDEEEDLLDDEELLLVESAIIFSQTFSDSQWPAAASVAGTLVTSGLGVCGYVQGRVEFNPVCSYRLKKIRWDISDRWTHTVKEVHVFECVDLYCADRCRSLKSKLTYRHWLVCRVFTHRME